MLTPQTFCCVCENMAITPGSDLTHLAGRNFLSSSSSVSLCMVMTLTAGLGVSEIMMGWVRIALYDWELTRALLWIQKQKIFHPHKTFEHNLCPCLSNHVIYYKHTFQAKKLCSNYTKHHWNIWMSKVNESESDMTWSSMVTHTRN